MRFLNFVSLLQFTYKNCAFLYSMYLLLYLKSSLCGFISIHTLNTQSAKMPNIKSWILFLSIKNQRNSTLAESLKRTSCMIKIQSLLPAVPRKPQRKKNNNKMPCLLCFFSICCQQRAQKGRMGKVH